MKKILWYLVKGPRWGKLSYVLCNVIFFPIVRRALAKGNEMWEEKKEPLECQLPKHSQRFVWVCDVKGPSEETLVCVCVMWRGFSEEPLICVWELHSHFTTLSLPVVWLAAVSQYLSAGDVCVASRFPTQVLHSWWPKMTGAKKNSNDLQGTKMNKQKEENKQESRR